MDSPDANNVLTADLNTQVERLFITPLLNKVEEPLPLVLLVDALDECSNQSKVVAGLISIAKTIPWVKIFVTSRNESAIRTSFAIAPAEIYHSINLNEVDDIEVDIRTYTVSKLRDLDLGTDQAEMLVKGAGGLFIWSATVFKYLEESHNRAEDLTDLAKGKELSAEPLEQLYALYDKVLETVPYKQKTATKALRRILVIVYVTSTTTPLPASAIASFLRKDPQFSRETTESVTALIRALHAVLYEDKNGGGVRVFHPSFLDYVGKKEGQEGWDMLTHIHRLMFEASVAIMDDKLKFNICGLKDAFLLNKDVPGLDRLVAKLIHLGLLYSCEHWFTHLHNSDLTASNSGSRTNVSRLVCDMKVLFWLEVLSLTGAAERSIRILQQCAQYFEVRRLHFLFECTLTSFKGLF